MARGMGALLVAACMSRRGRARSPADVLRGRLNLMFSAEYFISFAKPLTVTWQFNQLIVPYS
jgi:hypothetical protein